MTKTTTKQTGLKTQDDFEQCLNEAADLIHQRNLAQIDLDQALLSVRERFADPVQKYQELIDYKLAQAEAYAIRNRDSLLADGSKSAATAKVRWGWRLGNPALKLLSRRHTWATVCHKLVDTGRQAFLKIVAPKPDKDRLKAELSEDELAELGLRLEQTESFWIEPLDDSQNRESV